MRQIYQKPTKALLYCLGFGSVKDTAVALYVRQSYDRCWSLLFVSCSLHQQDLLRACGVRLLLVGSWLPGTHSCSPC